MTDARVRIEPQDIPPELDRWNWGAFLLNWIWGIGNNTYIALLIFVPIVGLVMPFVLGAKGSRWAWRNGRWDSVEHFKRVQRQWAIWGAVILVGFLLLFGGVFGGIFYGFAFGSLRLGAEKLRASSVAAMFSAPRSQPAFHSAAFTWAADPAPRFSAFRPRARKAPARFFWTRSRRTVCGRSEK